MEVKISVVIATLNCKNDIEQDLEQAICSFANQDYKNKELIIIDGMSTDGTLSLIEKYKDVISRSVSEKDNGIYDAYNKGVQFASGDYVVFLGADDSFYNNTILGKVAEWISEENMPDLLSTSIYYIDKGWAYIEKRSVLHGWEEGLKNKRPMVPHQGLYAKRELLLEHPFDTRYEICADLDFYAYCCSKNKRIVYKDRVTAYFSRLGISSRNELKTKKEEQKVLSTFGKTIKYNMAVCIRKTKLRKWIASHRLGMLLLIRFRGFRIHKCKNEHCRWCDFNRKRINGGM